ncbi:MAG: hypothetical protein JKY30_01980 [Flavobacteriales bacterium]|nr:hypothetical protein [Flavobacteriales bacterium]
MNQNKEESIDELRKNYEIFVFEMDDALESFIDSIVKLKISEVLPLDYSWESLNRIESICELYLDGKIFMELLPELFRTSIARYLGETLKKNMGGVWTFCDNPKEFAYGFPELGEIDNMNPKYAYNSFDTFDTFKIRRKKGLIRRAVESHLDYTLDKTNQKN